MALFFGFGFVAIVVATMAAGTAYWRALPFVAGFLFLPVATVGIMGLPDIDKALVVGVAAIVGSLVAPGIRPRMGRPGVSDLGAVLLCGSAFAASVSNGLGSWDGMASMLEVILVIGIPYVLGRLFFGTERGLRALLWATITGLVLYLPLIWFEMRFSPQLHRIAYGYHQHSFAQTKRFGGFRPVVFMQHGLAVSLWIAMGLLVAVQVRWFAPRGSLYRRVGPVLAVVVAVTLILSRSAGAVLVGAALSSCLVIFRPGLARRFLGLGALACGLYIGSRLVGANPLSAVASSLSDFVPDRAQSLQYRLDAEVLFVDHALARPMFGWGGYGRNRPPGSTYATDSFWVITLGKQGVVGLAGWTVLLSGGAVTLALSRTWWSRAGASDRRAAVVAAAICFGFMLDSLLNAMPNPLAFAITGSLSGVLSSGGGRRQASAVAADDPDLTESSSSVAT